MALKLYASNKLEELARIFREKIYDSPLPGSSIFASETVVVQTGGIERFLRKTLARESGIAANLDTPFLNKFVLSVMAELLPAEKFRNYRLATEQYSPEVLKWRLLDELSQHPGKYPEAEKYAQDPTRCYQLAALLASTFDRYIWYHPDMLNAWRMYPERKGHWEKELYLELLKLAGSSPDCFFADIFSENFRPARELALRRYSLFGVGAVPPLLLELCKKLGEFTDVHLFYLNPCGEYWGSMRSDMEKRRDARKNNETETELQIDNPLLANLGTWGREFFENTVDLMTDGSEERFVLPENPENKLLHRVQLDILNSSNSQLDLEDNLESQRAQYKNDRSISVHNCHSTRREVEVLHDQLLLALDELQVRPDDILVMAPDINTYAPIIETVFDARKLAYSISDRSLSSVSSVAENITRIIELHSARCTAEEILAIIDSPAIREGFELDDKMLSDIKNFIKQSGICWGENREDRERSHEISFEEFSWQDGFDRLLLGYAADFNEEEIFSINGPAPAGNTSGTRAELLGKLIFITENLFKWRQFCQQYHTVAEWTTLLEEILDTLYSRAYNHRPECEFIRRNLLNWNKKAAAVESSSFIPVGVLLAEMSSFISGFNAGSGFLTGGITFCSLVPMRSIPAKVIAVLGLKGLDFPRTDANNALNVSNARKKGERSKLLEDRYLFLETIISARERLLLFYPGQGTDDKTSCSPSAPLAALTDYLKNCFGFEETKHFRHAHNAEYFSSDDPNLCSFSTHFCEIAQCIRQQQTIEEKKQVPTIFAEPEDSEEVISYTIENLTDILNKPLKAYLKHTAKIKSDELEKFFSQEEEPATVELSDDVMTNIIARKKSFKDLHALLTATRELPPGEYGKVLFENKFNEIEAIQGLDKPVLHQFALSERVIIDVSVEDTVSGKKFRITGWVNQVPEQLNITMVSKYPGAFARIKFYLSCLCNSCQTQRETQTDDLAVIGNEVLNIPPYHHQEASAKLLELLLLAERAKTEVIPLLSRSSLAAATGGTPKGITGKFTGSYTTSGDIDTPYVKNFFSLENFDDETFMDEFRELAETVHAPWVKKGK